MSSQPESAREHRRRAPGPRCAVFAVALLASLTSSLTSSLERAIEGELRQMLGPAEQVEVKIERGRRFFLSPNLTRVTITVAGFKAEALPLEQMLQTPTRGGWMPGKIEEVVLRAERFEAQGLTIKLVEVRLQSVRYDLAQAIANRQFQMLGGGERLARVVLEEPALNQYLTTRVTQTELEDVRLRLLDGRLQVRGKARGPLGMKMPVELTAELEATPDGKINLIRPKAKAWLFPIPQGRVDKMVADMNPVVDLHDYIPGPIGIELTGARIKPSGITVTGRIIAREVRKPKAPQA